MPGDTASSRRRIPATSTGKGEGRACSGGSDATRDDESRYWRFGDKTNEDAAFDPKSKTETTTSEERISGKVARRTRKERQQKQGKFFATEQNNTTPQKMMLLHETHVTPSTQHPMLMEKAMKRVGKESLQQILVP